jgi:hypothetical protein
MSKCKKEIREQNISNGMCVECGKMPPITNKRLCEICSIKYKVSHKKVYENSKKKCKCWYCGSFSERTICEECSLKNAQKRDERCKLGACNKCGKYPATENRKTCLYCREVEKERDNKIKDLTFNVYGGYVCSCCGETIKEFLTIDHINNDGGIHRRQIKNRNIYKWLKKNSFPTGFQVLCWNCNLAKRFGKECPHKRIQKE